MSTQFSPGPETVEQRIETLWSEYHSLCDQIRELDGRQKATLRRIESLIDEKYGVKDERRVSLNGRGSPRA